MVLLPEKKSFFNLSLMMELHPEVIEPTSSQQITNLLDHGVQVTLPTVARLF